MRIIHFMFLVAFLALPRATFAADGTIGVRALLVLASNQRGESDPRLSAFEPNLRRMLRFESYRLAGEGSAELGSLGKGTANLGHGHSLQLENEKSDGGVIRLRVNWLAGGRSLINTVLALRPGVPAVLGGPSSGKEGEVWAIILIAN
jgi:hypothetical protein